MRNASNPVTLKAKEKTVPAPTEVGTCTSAKKVPQVALLLTLRLGYTEWAVRPDH